MSDWLVFAVIFGIPAVMAGLSIAEFGALKVPFLISLVLWVLTALVYWPGGYSAGEMGALMVFGPLLKLSFIAMITMTTALFATLFFGHKSKSNFQGEKK